MDTWEIFIYFIFQPQHLTEQVLQTAGFNAFPHNPVDELLKFEIILLNKLTNIFYLYFYRLRYGH